MVTLLMLELSDLMIIGYAMWLHVLSFLFNINALTLFKHY